jgi:hypothetical protein
MKWQTFRMFLEKLSFYLWIIFTIFSISVTGLGIEGILFAAYMLIVSSAVPVHFPVGMVMVGGLGVFLSIFWRQVGIDYFHYLAYDTLPFSEGDSEAPSQVLHQLIRKVEGSGGYERNDARAKAKAWLIEHVSSLDEEDILLAKAHFGYLLPAEWGGAGSVSPAMERR